MKITLKLVMRYLTSFAKSATAGMSLILTAHLNSDSSHFKCWMVTMCPAAPWVAALSFTDYDCRKTSLPPNISKRMCETNCWMDERKGGREEKREGREGGREDRCSQPAETSRRKELQLRLDPWPGNFHMPQILALKKPKTNEQKTDEGNAEQMRLSS